MADNSDITSSKNVRKVIKNYPTKKRAKVERTLNSIPKHMKCNCGGGQSCIVNRRWLSDYVHEDKVFKNAGLPLRKHCKQPYYAQQVNALNNDMNNDTINKQKSITDRWTDDSNFTQL